MAHNGPILSPQAPHPLFLRAPISRVARDLIARARHPYGAEAISSPHP